MERIRNRNGVITTLVRQSYHDDGKVRKRTVANITHLPEQIQLSIARQLKDETELPASAFEVVGSRGHGSASGRYYPGGQNQTWVLDPYGDLLP